MNVAFFDEIKSYAYNISLLYVEYGYLGVSFAVSPNLLVIVSFVYEAIL
ncbi:hypothetical protein DSUL_50393 [Desulfovibrionales bacterium]